MRVKVMQNWWHFVEFDDAKKPAEKRPIYSLDFHPSGTLVTAGADNEIKFWKVQRPCKAGQGLQCRALARWPHLGAPSCWQHTIHPPACSPARPPAHLQVGRGEDSYPTVEFTGTLDYHQKTVNCVRFAPSGEGCQRSECTRCGQLLAMPRCSSTS